MSSYNHVELFKLFWFDAFWLILTSLWKKGFKGNCFYRCRELKRASCLKISWFTEKVPNFHCAWLDIFSAQFHCWRIPQAQNSVFGSSDCVFGYHSYFSYIKTVVLGEGRGLQYHDKRRKKSCRVKVCVQFIWDGYLQCYSDPYALGQLSITVVMLISMKIILWRNCFV